MRIRMRALVFPSSACGCAFSTSKCTWAARLCTADRSRPRVELRRRQRTRHLHVSRETLRVPPQSHTTGAHIRRPILQLRFPTTAARLINSKHALHCGYASMMQHGTRGLGGQQRITTIAPCPGPIPGRAQALRPEVRQDPQARDACARGRALALDRQRALRLAVDPGPR